ncbi:hypothetical protein K474DRAFT_1769896 [Panus rudis PR-1116 ss-1]|nr:hypothetical protein K474DRAFT_1769896 [Panus rudis PR-1116 ss-1]
MPRPPDWDRARQQPCNSPSFARRPACQKPQDSPPPSVPLDGNIPQPANSPPQEPEPTPPAQASPTPSPADPPPQLTTPLPTDSAGSGGNGASPLVTPTGTSTGPDVLSTSTSTRGDPEPTGDKRTPKSFNAPVEPPESATSDVDDTTAAPTDSSDLQPTDSNAGVTSNSLAFPPAFDTTAAPNPTPSSVDLGTGAVTSHSTRRVGPIVGGVIGGIALLILLIVAFILWRRRRRRRRHHLAPSAEFMHHARDRSLGTSPLPYGDNPRYPSLMRHSSIEDPDDIPPPFTQGTYKDPVYEKVDAAEAQKALFTSVSTPAPPPSAFRNDLFTADQSAFARLGGESSRLSSDTLTRPASGYAI